MKKQNSKESQLIPRKYSKHCFIAIPFARRKCSNILWAVVGTNLKIYFYIRIDAFCVCIFYTQKKHTAENSNEKCYYMYICTKSIFFY